MFEGHIDFSIYNSKGEMTHNKLFEEMYHKYSNGILTESEYFNYANKFEELGVDTSNLREILENEHHYYNLMEEMKSNIIQYGVSDDLVQHYREQVEFCNKTFNESYLQECILERKKAERQKINELMIQEERKKELEKEAFLLATQLEKEKESVIAKKMIEFSNESDIFVTENYQLIVITKNNSEIKSVKHNIYETIAILEQHPDLVKNNLIIAPEKLKIQIEDRLNKICDFTLFQTIQMEREVDLSRANHTIVINKNYIQSIHINSWVEV